LSFESRKGEDAVDAFEENALFAVVKGAINARKCLTKGGLIGEGNYSWRLDLVL
jgi:hypothetical protein